MKPCTTAVDIYNIGLCLYESCTRKYWCMSADPEEILAEMAGDSFVTNLVSGGLGERFSAELSSFLRRCLKYDKRKRACAGELQRHEWICKKKTKLTNRTNALDEPRPNRFFQPTEAYEDFQLQREATLSV